MQEEQEQLAEVEAEARAELNAAQAQLREAQEAVAISADKVAQLAEALKEAKVCAALFSFLCVHQQSNQATAQHSWAPSQVCCSVLRLRSAW